MHTYKTLTLGEAHTIIRTAPERGPYWAHWAECWRGACLMGLGQYAEAEPVARKAVELAPDNATTQYHAGMIYYRVGRKDDATFALRRALQLDPLSLPINTDVGFQMFYVGKYDAAIEQLKKTLQMNPKFPLAHLWLGQTGVSDPSIRPSNAAERYSNAVAAELLVPLDEFPQHADLAVECAPAAILERICRPMLTAGKQVMVLSASALLPRPDLVDLARAQNAKQLRPVEIALRPACQRHRNAPAAALRQFLA